MTMVSENSSFLIPNLRGRMNCLAAFWRYVCLRRRDIFAPANAIC